MTKSCFFPSLVLLAVALAACTPEAVSTNSPAATTQPLIAVSTPTLTTLVPEAATQPAEATALPIATSRGPDLHATDPATVSLASGGLQFVEFFRFT
jgi:hypothetical protein